MTNRLLATLCLIILSLAVRAQKTSLNTTVRKTFSQSVQRDVSERLNALNENSDIRVVLNVSLFYLENKAITLKAEQAVKKNSTLETTIEDALESARTQITQTQFENLYRAADLKAQTSLDKLSNKNKTLFVNLSLAIRVDPGKKGQFARSYCHIKLLEGAEVPKDITQDFQKYTESPLNPGYDIKTGLFDDDFLLELIDALYTSVLSVIITYDDPEAKNLDDNRKYNCESYKSFKTQPVNGIPWKCIPSDGTFTPVKVNVTTKLPNSANRIEFRVSDPVNFKLRSPELDANSLLWISGSAGNKEAAILPVVNGHVHEVKKINIVAYEKIKKKVAVVIVDEENDDEQVFPNGKTGLTPYIAVVKNGPNLFLDTQPGGDDRVVRDPDSGYLTVFAGPNGICETQASNTNASAPDVDRMELQRQLNLFYNPAMVEWEVIQTKFRKAINYDLDQNGKLDLDWYAEDPNNKDKTILVHGPEEAAINNGGKMDPAIEHYIFVVSDIGGDGGDEKMKFLFGRQTGDLKSAIVFSSQLQKFITYKTEIADADNPAPPPLRDAMITTAAHELGHAGWHDLFDFEGTDQVNLMTHGHPLLLSKSVFRKFQWDIIHGHSSP